MLLGEEEISGDKVANFRAGCQSIDVVEGPTVLAVAARVGNTRLIDNLIIG